MTTPTQHLEIFDEKHWSKMIKEHKWADEIMLNDIRQHLIQTVISVLEEQIEKMCSVLSDYHKKISEYQNDYNIKSIFIDKSNTMEHVIHSLTTTLSTWNALL